MINGREQERDPKSGEQQLSDREKHNPFKEKVASDKDETTEEDATAEQQRKDALTERD